MKKGYELDAVEAAYSKEFADFANYGNVNSLTIAGVHKYSPVVECCRYGSEVATEALFACLYELQQAKAGMQVVKEFVLYLRYCESEVKETAIEGAEHEPFVTYNIQITFADKFLEFTAQSEFNYRTIGRGFRSDRFYYDCIDNENN